MSFRSTSAPRSASASTISRVLVGYLQVRPHLFGKVAHDFPRGSERALDSQLSYASHFRSLDLFHNLVDRTYDRPT